MTGEGAGTLAAVAVPVPVRHVFVYRVPPALDPLVAPGVRVRVPLGRRRVEGTIVEVGAAPPGRDVEIREISSILERGPRLDPPLLALTRFVADYYLCSWGEAIEAALPPDPGPEPLTRLARRVPGADPASLSPRAAAQRRILEALPADGAPLAVGRLGRAGRRALPALVRRGLVEIVAEARAAGGGSDDGAGGAAETPPTPTPAQAAVLERLLPAVAAGGFAPFLLFGATGSGKTEVYLRAAASALEAGRGVLYLVPEIGLTPLLVSRLVRRFPGEVAVLHSALGARERRGAWEEVRAGRRRVVVGARSAVFAPVPRLGLVVVDEEHDGSYKQDERPRYHARDLAVVRARDEKAVLVLGSATPSLDSFHHARTGRYALLRLGGRVEARPLPAVRVVDMRREFRETAAVLPLSRALTEALRACIERGEQALVLRNRRGWAAALLCPGCGARVTCPRCSLSLTWHRGARRLRCHMCGIERGRPEACPACGSEGLRELGEGTERIEDELAQALPGARIERMDRDTVRRRGAHERLLRRFERGEVDVLVGTQMIAKGHDFPRVTLVGVLSADHALGLPDFRAAERTFQLLTQMAGRAGRGELEGEVVIQAFDPSHPVLREAAAHDYEAFYEREMGYRRSMRYPPLSALVQVIVTDADSTRARGWAELLVAALREQGDPRLLLTGPGPAPIERIRGLHREQVLVRSAGRRKLVEAVSRALEAVEGKVPRRAVQVDVDPLSVL